MRFPTHRTRIIVLSAANIFLLVCVSLLVPMPLPTRAGRVLLSLLSVVNLVGFLWHLCGG
jgi:hypothetical protein